MKRLYFVACISTIFFACQKPSTSTPSFTQNIDPAFETYWQSFKDEADARMLNPAIYEQDVSIQFGDLPEGIHGECNEIGSDSIIISRVSWDTLDDTRREILIFHEIGHCQLGRQHEQDGSYLLSKTVAHSLMIPDLNGSNAVYDLYSPKWRDYYIDELFGLSSEPNWLDMGIPFDAFGNSIEMIFELNDIEANSTSSSTVDVEEESQFQAVAQNSTTGDFSIIANDLLINYSYELSGFTIHMDGQQLANVNFFWYSNQVRSTGTVTITLRYVDDYIHFYIGDYLVHFREYPKPANLDLSIQSQGGALDARLAVDRL